MYEDMGYSDRIYDNWVESEKVAVLLGGLGEMKVTVTIADHTKHMLLTGWRGFRLAEKMNIVVISLDLEIGMKKKFK